MMVMMVLMRQRVCRERAACCAYPCAREARHQLLVLGRIGRKQLQAAEGALLLGWMAAAAKLLLAAGVAAVVAAAVVVRGRCRGLRRVHRMMGWRGCCCLLTGVTAAVFALYHTWLCSLMSCRYQAGAWD